MVADDNQPALKADVALLVSRPPGPEQELRLVQNVSYGHGRLEPRTRMARADLNGFVNWPRVEQGWRLARRVVALATGEITTAIEDGVVSLRPDQLPLFTVLTRWRGHWPIENHLPWSRDVVMRAAASRVRSGPAPETWAALPNAGLSLVPQLGSARLSIARRHLALHFQEPVSLIGIS